MPEFPDEGAGAADESQLKTKLNGTLVGEEFHVLADLRRSKTVPDYSRLIEICNVPSSIHSDFRHSGSDLATPNVARNVEAPFSSSHDHMHEAASQIVPGAEAEIAAGRLNDSVSRFPPNGRQEVSSFCETLHVFEGTQTTGDSNEVPPTKTPLCDAVPFSKTQGLTFIVGATALIVGALIARALVGVDLFLPALFFDYQSLLGIVTG